MNKYKIYPINENRQKAWEHCLGHFCSIEANRAREKSKDKKAQEILGFKLDENEVAGAQSRIEIKVSGLAKDYLSSVISDILMSGEDGWAKICDALSIGYMGFEITYCLNRLNPIFYSRAETIDYYYIGFHSFLSGIGMWKESDTMNRYLMNLWLSDAIDHRLQEQEDFIGFYWYLLRAQYKGEWPSLDEFEMELGEFYQLFKFVSGSKAEFKEALLNYCDFRLARMHGYPNQHTKKQYHDLHSDALTYGPLYVFPVELLAFKAIYERITCNECDINVDHPILNSKLMFPPKGMMLSKNDFTQKIDDLGKLRFKNDWQLYQLGDVYWENAPWDR